MNFNLFISVFIFILLFLDPTVVLCNNQAKNYCAIKKINYVAYFLGKDIFYAQEVGLKGDIKNSDFTLDNESYEMIEKQVEEYQNKIAKLGKVELKWLCDIKQSSSLTKQFNLTAFIRLIRKFDYYPIIEFLHYFNSRWH